jgi:trehalose/maltose hydrolase-like predicted phosphorylase
LQTGSEIDYVEEYEGNLAAYEFKFGNKQLKASPAWCEAYPEASFQTVNKDNWLPFVVQPEGINGVIEK